MDAYWPRIGAFYMTNDAGTDGSFTSTFSPYNNCGAMDYSIMDAVVGIGCLGPKCSESHLYCGTFYDEQLHIDHGDCRWSNKAGSPHTAWCPQDYIMTDHWTT